MIRPCAPIVARLAGLAALVMGATIAAPAAAAQAVSMRASGSIGVSLEILQPVASQQVSVVGFTVDRAGIATLETTAPVRGSTSQIMMTSISSSAAGFVPVRQAPALVAASRPSSSDANVVDSIQAPGTRISYQINVGRHAAASTAPVQLRVQYLAVAGT